MKPWIIRGAERLRRTGVYGLAVLAGLVAAWAVREHVQQRVQALEAEAQTPLVSRLVAAYDLPAGTLLEEVHLAVRKIPQPWAPGASVDPMELGSVLGATLLADLAHGDPLLRSFMTYDPPQPSLAARLEAGQRAFTVNAADLGGLADMLKGGDAIDIYVTFNHRQRELTVPVLQSMRVLTAMSDDGAGNITLAATPDQAMRFIAARQAGVLTAMLRHRDDAASVNPVAQSDLASLMGLDAEPKPVPGVAIVYGDRLDAQAGFDAERP
ncbi:Flp pilus assembly protein CpaB [Achromobacter mucicolens]|uniref:Flp pilus assembly protein CpaB n=1 Tax=Achromobacter mucicolens TaxID=1389922 RepID=UPI001466A54C|nr:Flp pilus assembly protein CpaB [Achromobacter mucicolens]CAB3905427.1 hypothetical protein LMG26686_04710 [Achromobacter mucicolens]